MDIQLIKTVAVIALLFSACLSIQSLIIVFVYRRGLKDQNMIPSANEIIKTLMDLGRSAEDGEIDIDVNEILKKVDKKDTITEELDPYRAQYTE